MITFTAVDFFQVLDLENYNELDLFNLANTEGIDMENIGEPGLQMIWLPRLKGLWHEILEL